MYLFFEELSFVAAYFVLVDDVDCACEFSFLVDGFSEFVELILFEAGGEEVVLVFDAALDLFDEVVLFELDVVFFVGDLVGGVVGEGVAGR